MKNADSKKNEFLLEIYLKSQLLIHYLRMQQIGFSEELPNFICYQKMISAIERNLKDQFVFLDCNKLDVSECFYSLKKKLSGIGSTYYSKTLNEMFQIVCFDKFHEQRKAYNMLWDLGAKIDQIKINQHVPYENYQKIRRAVIYKRRELEVNLHGINVSAFEYCEILSEKLQKIDGTFCFEHLKNHVEKTLGANNLSSEKKCQMQDPDNKYDFYNFVFTSFKPLIDRINNKLHSVFVFNRQIWKERLRDATKFMQELCVQFSEDRENFATFINKIRTMQAQDNTGLSCKLKNLFDDYFKSSGLNTHRIWSSNKKTTSREQAEEAIQNIIQYDFKQMTHC